MKHLNIKILGLLSFILFFTSCEYDGIDPITPVEPGEDAASPVVTINSPVEGATINVLEEVSSININFEVVDDIEVAEIQVMVDGNMIARMDEFLDYRIVKDQVTFDNVTNGEHTVTVSATDLDGNTTTKTVNFSKEPPYTPKFPELGEALYMPFDGAYIDLMTLTEADVVGEPGFTGESYLGSAAYKGASESYLELPFTGLGTSFTATFWYKVSGDPNRAGILVAGDDADDRFQGFRLFREGSATEQTLKLNVGTGNGESWNNGGVLNVEEGDWVHVAFTVTETESVLYFNGVPVNTGTLAAPIDWSGVEDLTIGHGGETFSYWNHLYDSSAIDELRFFDQALSGEEIQNLINASAETLYMAFDGDYKDLASNREVTVVGDPGFAGEAVEGSNAYEGAEGAYLTVPSAGLTSESFSATMWYNLNADPNRAGIIVIGPEDTENAGYPDTQNKRTSGFRFFRENGAEGHQRFKLNVGTGEGETWVDGGAAADVPNDAGWVHLAFTISPSSAIVYINGEVAKESEIPGIDWTGTSIVSIMSGAPRFTAWGHLSDRSLLDELKFYNKALSQEEIQAMMQ
ncbi:Ig-like domain-containing protein [Gramella sp. GC03-9]|uniref:Ig-like domain-containing protein n=1 Tax=Christiangramia oceanisediminis TaxID=2920386 RepID=A0A9X2KVA5_9FLAO|nr:LamG-like jellyroll fold domain-containing protein [Gramella oceanisediminis]MCP9198480.1 Ig-like domain-containing protein [Gramella oceanisediminis]